MNYDADRILNTYLLFHYGSRGEILAGSQLEAAGASFPDAFFEFPVATVRDTFDLSSAPFGRALDVGCAVGRSTFELSRFADEVIGIDFSVPFIEAANRLQSGEVLPYARYGEAHLTEPLIARAPEDARHNRVSFETGDAMDLRPDLGAFDLVHAANLLCRLAEPRRFLDRLPDLVKPGGQLVLATPATWWEEFTPPGNQPAGPTLAYLDDILGPTFERQTVSEIPFFICEHVRKHQVSTSQTSTWIRKPGATS